MAKLFTLAEVSEHNTSKDCWLVINGKVYDVTKFLEDHPGGDEVLVSSTGKDATDDFEDVGHSATAKAMMEEFYVGDVNTSTISSKTAYTPPKQPQYNQDRTSQFIIRSCSSWFHLLSWEQQLASDSTASHPPERALQIIIDEISRIRSEAT